MACTGSRPNHFPQRVCGAMDSSAAERNVGTMALILCSWALQKLEHNKHPRSLVRARAGQFCRATASNAYMRTHSQRTVIPSGPLGIITNSRFARHSTSNCAATVALGYYQ
jgi:hypothetical protein